MISATRPFARDPRGPSEAAALRDPPEPGPSRANAIYAIDAACGAVLRNARRRKGLQQLEIARHFGVYPSNISQWESGRTRIPEEHIPALSTLLGLPADALRRPEPFAQTHQELTLLQRFRSATGAKRRAALEGLCP